MVVLGTLILAFGWFGFNPGSTLAATDLRIGSIAVCTMLATAAGCLSSILYMWAVFGKPDPTMGCNGLLAGAVAITAPCAFVNPVGAVIIGAIAGVLVIWSVLFVERVLKVDDPVGAVSVHGVCGAFGCLSHRPVRHRRVRRGLERRGQPRPDRPLLRRRPRASSPPRRSACWPTSSGSSPRAFVSFMIIEKTIGNRTPARAEVEGLDIPEMGVLGYVNEDTRRRPGRRPGAPLDLRAGRPRQVEGRAEPERPRRPELTIAEPRTPTGRRRAGRRAADLPSGPDPDPGGPPLRVATRPRLDLPGGRRRSPRRPGRPPVRRPRRCRRRLDAGLPARSLSRSARFLVADVGPPASPSRNAATRPRPGRSTQGAI